MEVLFVCKGNVGRSQMAAALYSKYSGHKPFSAGINVGDNEGKILKNRPKAEVVIRLMKKEGLDIANNTRKQVTPELVKCFDHIIVLGEKMPENLTKIKAVETWDIQDPEGMDDACFEKTISQIKEHIKKFLKAHEFD